MKLNQKLPIIIAVLFLIFWAITVEAAPSPPSNFRFVTNSNITILVDVDYTFAWDANSPTESIVAYRIYWSDISNTYNATDWEGIPVSSLADPDNPEWTITLPLVNEDDKVYFVATAVDDDGLESDYSYQVATSEVSLDNIVGGFYINSGDNTAFTLSGQSSPDSVVTIFVNGDSTLWSTTADPTDGSWSYTADFSSITVDQGPLTIDARIIATGDSSGVISGTLDSVEPTFDSGPASVGETHNSATIEWTTDEDTQTLLEYSAISGNPVPIEIEDLAFIPSHLTHSMAIPGLGGDPLTKSTTYYYKVIATDAAGNQTETPELLFVTKVEPDTTAPIVTPHEATDIGYDTATVSWTVNEPSDSELQYTITSGDWTSPSTASDSGTGLRSVTLIGLNANETYYFRVSASDTSDNGPTITGEKEFTTLAAPDITPPIFDVAPTAGPINTTSATITWGMDEPSDSVVEYGLTESYGLSVEIATDVPDNILHSVPLTGLTANTTYYYRVGSTDDDNNGPTWSGNKSFKTLETPDIDDPVIIGAITVINVTDTSARIEWETDEYSDSQVQYGTPPEWEDTSWDGYPERKNDITMVKDHSVNLTGLTPNTLYVYSIGSSDSAHNGPTVSAESDFLTEATPDTSAPQFTTPPTVTGVSQTSAIIEWDTDEAATSLLQYGTAAESADAVWGGYPSELNSVELKTSHSVTLTNLIEDTEYLVMVGSEDALSNGPTTSIETSFKTESVDNPLAVDVRPRLTLPPTLTGITDDTATIAWETDEPANSEVRYDTAETGHWEYYTDVAVDSELKTVHSLTLTNLDSAKRYYYRVGSTDASGNGPNLEADETNNPFSEDIFTTEVTPDVTEPRILTAPKVVAVDAISATITWETNEPSNSLVQYGLTNTDLGLTLTAGDGEMVTQHSVTLSNLGEINVDPEDDFPGPGDRDTNGNGTHESTTTYYFRAASTDLSGNEPFDNLTDGNPSARLNFITLTSVDTAPPVITNVVMTFATNKTALITWTTDEPANSLIRCGQTSWDSWEGDYSYSESDAEMKTEHSSTITGLQPSVDEDNRTTYYFRVGSMDAKQNFGSSADEYEFITDISDDETAPQIPIGNPTIVVNVGAKSAVVTWSTPDEPGNSQVQFDESSQVWGAYAFNESDAEMTRTHSVTLTDLKIDTLYYWRVSSVDAAGNNHASMSLDLNPSREYDFILKVPYEAPDKDQEEGADPETPVAYYPEDDAINIELEPTLKVSLFVDQDLIDRHGKSEWQVSTDSEFTDIVFSEISSVHLSELTIPHTLLRGSTKYYWRVKFYDSTDRFSIWSDINSFTTMPDSDNNNNGIPDDKEDQTNTIDLNNNLIPDNDPKDDIKTLRAETELDKKEAYFGVSSEENTEIIIEYVDTINLNSISDLERPSSMPLGLITFRITNITPGGTIKIKVYFSERADDDARWYVYDTINSWHDFNYLERADFAEDRKSVTVTLTDGSYGDADGRENGIIIDPAGFGIASFVQGIVKDALTQKGIPNSKITIGDLVFTANSNGEYKGMILPDTYTVGATGICYHEHTYSDKIVEVGEDLDINFELEPDEACVAYKPKEKKKSDGSSNLFESFFCFINTLTK